MTEPHSRRPVLVASMVALGVFAVGAAGAATFNAFAGANPRPASAAADISSAGNPVPPAEIPPSIELDPADPAATATGVRTRTTAPTTKRPTTSKPARDSEFPPPPQKPIPTRTITAAPAPSYQEDVEADEPCAPEGAVGHTSDGTLMSCDQLGTDQRNRWTEVIPPPPLK
ncbi:hypothetical protein [Actinoplanes sp. NPDC026619]|uniref:hypothetical protein n=1 Tax=Actinoplanes sp. NPDC026619 TaxID=3155798 RepID=UPI00340BFEBB